MNQVLELLVERAEGARDQATRQAQEARKAAQMVEGTLDRLQLYRSECLARSPTMRTTGADAQSLRDYQQFVSRLDEAIQVQKNECVFRQSLVEGAQRHLLQAQQRLMALQTLVKRRVSVATAKDARRAQAASDEFAALAGQRSLQGAWL